MENDIWQVERLSPDDYSKTVTENTVFSTLSDFVN